MMISAAVGVFVTVTCSLHYRRNDFRLPIGDILNRFSVFKFNESLVQSNETSKTKRHMKTSNQNPTRRTIDALQMTFTMRFRLQAIARSQTRYTSASIALSIG